MPAHDRLEPSDPSDPSVGPATVYLIVGLPGAGKTTRAKELEIERVGPPADAGRVAADALR